MTLNFATAEDIDFTGGLIDNGTICKLRIINLAKKSSAATPGNEYLSIDFEVAEGKFAGSQIRFEQIGIAGTPKYVGFGSSKIKAILEYTRNITDGKTGNYNISGYEELKGMYALAVIKQEYYTDKDNISKVANKIDRYGSPRMDSSRYAVFEAYSKGEQPFLQPNLPKVADVVNSVVRNTNEIPL